MSLYTISLTIESDDDEAPGFSMNAGQLTRAQLEGFLCMTGSFYENMTSENDSNRTCGEEPTPDA